MVKLAAKVPTEAAAYEYLETLRWPGGMVTCPHCGVVSDHHYFLAAKDGMRQTRTGALSDRRVWKCRSCKRQFSVITGTFLHGTKVPIRTWVLVIFEMAANKNGIAAREIERRYGVAPKTAWHMAHRLREAMGNRLVPPFSGDVSVDETYIGGDPQNWHASKREKLHTHKGMSQHKAPVVAVIDADTGQARSTVVEWVDSKSLRDLLTATVDMPTTVLHTDAHRSYPVVARKMAGHFAVNHTEGEYVTEKSRGTQMCENLFSQLKRSLDGTHHHVSRKHLQRYVGEFDFRYSTRKVSDAERMGLLIDQLIGRLPYLRLVR